MTPLATNTTDPAHQSRWHGRLRQIGHVTVIVLIPVLVILLIEGYLNYRGQQRLADAIAEADRLDPEWRLADLLAQEPAIPGSENGALLLVDAFRFKNKDGDWGMLQEGYRDQELFSLRPYHRLPPAKAKMLRDAMTAVEPARMAARKLADRPRGRLNIEWSANPPFSVGSFYNASATVHLLNYDAQLRAEDGDVEGAMVSARAALHVSGYLSAATESGYFEKQGCYYLALECIEHNLAQGQAGESTLKGLQEILEADDQRSELLPFWRHDRANYERWLALFGEGKTPLSQLPKVSDSPKLSFFPQWLQDFKDRFSAARRLARLPAERAARLRYVTRLVEIAKLPVEDQWPAILEHDATLKDQPWLTRTLAPHGPRVYMVYCRYLAGVRTAMTALAAERFRLRHGRWPKALEELTPDFLARVPRDPFANAPLRLIALDDGIIIYSVGDDRHDDGGDIPSNLPPGKPGGRDAGFRLWDPDKRRQPPPAPQAEDKKP
jgi:hypothetical protein